VPIKVHASKVMLIRLNLEDKLRRERLESLKSRASGTGEGEAHG
jgi:hypothetical protein